MASASSDVRRARGVFIEPDRGCRRRRGDRGAGRRAPLEMCTFVRFGEERWTANRDAGRRIRIPSVVARRSCATTNTLVDTLAACAVRSCPKNVTGRSDDDSCRWVLRYHHDAGPLSRSLPFTPPAVAVSISRCRLPRRSRVGVARGRRSIASARSRARTPLPGAIPSSLGTLLSRSSFCRGFGRLGRARASRRSAPRFSTASLACGSTTTRTTCARSRSPPRTARRARPPRVQRRDGVRAGRGEGTSPRARAPSLVARRRRRRAPRRRRRPRPSRRRRPRRRPPRRPRRRAHATMDERDRRPACAARDPPLPLGVPYLEAYADATASSPPVSHPRPLRGSARGRGPRRRAPRQRDVIAHLPRHRATARQHGEATSRTSASRAATPVAVLKVVNWSETPCTRWRLLLPSLLLDSARGGSASVAQRQGRAAAGVKRRSTTRRTRSCARAYLDAARGERFRSVPSRTRSRASPPRHRRASRGPRRRGRMAE